MDSDFTQEEKECAKLSEVEYFNWEVSPCETTFVINASKKGLASFLNLYGHLEIPPKSISVEQWLRPQRRWNSAHLYENKDVLPTDPSPYIAYVSTEANSLYSIVNIQFLSTDHLDSVVAAGFREKVPVLIVNKKGWKVFLDMLRHLLNNSYWFYVAPPTPNSRCHLPFLLTVSYPGYSSDQIFKAMEFIRLEPEKQIYLNAIPHFLSLKEEPSEEIKVYVDIDMGGNSAGLLLFSKWMRDFASGRELSQDIFNHWNDIFKSVMIGQSSKEKEPPSSSFYLRKTCMDSSYPIFAFGAKKDESKALYIFGNTKGFLELADIAEGGAFCSDHDRCFSRPAKQRCRGDLCSEVLPPPGIYLAQSWELYQGGLYNSAYNPFANQQLELKLEQEREDEIRNFVNKRIVV